MLARYFKNDGNGAAIGKGEFVRDLTDLLKRTTAEEPAEPLVRPPGAGCRSWPPQLVWTRFAT